MDGGCGHHLIGGEGWVWGVGGGVGSKAGQEEGAEEGEGGSVECRCQLFRFHDGKDPLEGMLIKNCKIIYSIY